MTENSAPWGRLIKYMVTQRLYLKDFPAGVRFVTEWPELRLLSIKELQLLHTDGFAHEGDDDTIMNISFSTWAEGKQSVFS